MRPSTLCTWLGDYPSPPRFDDPNAGEKRRRQQEEWELRSPKRRKVRQPPRFAASITADSAVSHKSMGTSDTSRIYGSKKSASWFSRFIWPKRGSDDRLQGEDREDGEDRIKRQYLSVPGEGDNPDTENGYASEIDEGYTEDEIVDDTVGSMENVEEVTNAENLQNQEDTTTKDSDMDISYTGSIPEITTQSLDEYLTSETSEYTRSDPDIATQSSDEYHPSETSENDDYSDVDSQLGGGNAEMNDNHLDISYDGSVPDIAVQPPTDESEISPSSSLNTSQASYRPSETETRKSEYEDEYYLYGPPGGRKKKVPKLEPTPRKDVRKTPKSRKTPARDIEDSIPLNFQKPAAPKTPKNRKSASPPNEDALPSRPQKPTPAPPQPETKDPPFEDINPVTPKARGKKTSTLAPPPTTATKKITTTGKTKIPPKKTADIPEEETTIKSPIKRSTITTGSANPNTPAPNPAPSENLPLSRHSAESIYTFDHIRPTHKERSFEAILAKCNFTKKTVADLETLLHCFPNMRWSEGKKDWVFDEDEEGIPPNAMKGARPFNRPNKKLGRYPNWRKDPEEKEKIANGEGILTRQYLEEVGLPEREQSDVCKRFFEEAASWGRESEEFMRARIEMRKKQAEKRRAEGKGKGGKGKRGKGKGGKGEAGENNE